MYTCNINTLKDNAILSIRNGINEFEIYKVSEGTSRDTNIFSIISNLFDGTLLLFKYKIALLIYQNDNKMTFGLPLALLYADISVIQQYCKMLNINIDWKLIQKLKEDKNYLENCGFPQNNPYVYSVVEMFISEILSVLCIFFQIELGESISDLLEGLYSGMSEYNQDSKVLS